VLLVVPKCDRCGELFHSLTQEHARGISLYLRERMRVLGWLVVGGGKDYCPDCAEEAARNGKGMQSTHTIDAT